MSMARSQDHQRSIEALIARTSAAMPMEVALKAIADRKARLLSGRAAPLPPIIEEADFAEREPMPPLDDTEAFAAGFWQRLKDRQERKKETPPRGSKPRLVVDNDNPVPPKKA
jgi:hypothetical protein